MSFLVYLFSFTPEPVLRQVTGITSFLHVHCCVSMIFFFSQFDCQPISSHFPWILSLEKYMVNFESVGDRLGSFPLMWKSGALSLAWLPPFTIVDGGMVPCRS